MRKQKEMKLHLLRLGIVNALRIHADGLDDLWLFRHVVVHVAVHAGDVHSGLRILGDLTKRRILTVKVRRVGHHDEKLAARALVFFAATVTQQPRGTSTMALT